MANHSESRLSVMRPGYECAHLEALGDSHDPRADACEECGAPRTLRVCLTCGHVGCCDSHQAHARRHARETGHPLIKAWKGGAFVYCFEHGYQ